MFNVNRLMKQPLLILLLLIAQLAFGEDDLAEYMGNGLLKGLNGTALFGLSVLKC